REPGVSRAPRQPADQALGLARRHAPLQVARPHPAAPPRARRQRACLPPRVGGIPGLPRRARLPAAPDRRVRILAPAAIRRGLLRGARGLDWVRRLVGSLLSAPATR